MSNNIYGGYTDESSVEVKGSNLKFGLNQKCKLTNIKFDETDPNNIFAEFSFNVHGTDVNYRIYPVVEVMDNNVKISDPTHDAFKKALADLGARVTSIFKCFTSEQAIINAVQNLRNASFKDYIQAHLKLINPSEARNIELDIFMNYRYSADDEGKKYLEISKTRKHGAFICKHLPGNYTEIKDADGLHYLNKDNGMQHPFTRSKWFMDSEYAKGSSTPNTPANTIMSAPGNISNPFNTPSSNNPTTIGEIGW